MYLFIQQTTDPSAAQSAEQVDINTGSIWTTVDNMLDGFIAILPKLGIAIIVFVLFWLIAKGVKSLIKRATSHHDNANVGQVLSRLAYFGIIIFGLLVAVSIVAPSMTPAKLLSVLGIGGVAIGFAFKDIFQNMLAGILILLREPFKVGDEIVSGDFVGKVEAIETRATFIRTYDGQRVIIPNSDIYTDPVTVKTAYDLIRSQYDIGIGYGDDIEQAKQVILDAITGIDGVLNDPAPDVLTWDLAGASVNIRARWWSEPDRAGVVALRDRVLKAVKVALDDASVDMPYPTQVVLFHDQTEETDGDRTRQREGWPLGDNPPEARTISGALHEMEVPSSKGDTNGRASANPTTKDAGDASRQDTQPTA